MSANVRCASREEWAEGIGWTPMPGCGWKGERGRAVPEGWWKHPTEAVNYLTRKPCPRCGGKVALIPQRGDQ